MGAFNASDSCQATPRKPMEIIKTFTKWSPTSKPSFLILNIPYISEILCHLFTTELSQQAHFIPHTPLFPELNNVVEKVCSSQESTLNLREVMCYCARSRRLLAGQCVNVRYRSDGLYVTIGVQCQWTHSWFTEHTAAVQQTLVKKMLRDHHVFITCPPLSRGRIFFGLLY